MTVEPEVVQSGFGEKELPDPSLHPPSSNQFQA